jgi:SynChlorMet cassette protein ScmD
MAHPEVVLREEFDDWAVLFNPDTADAVGINPVGVALWKNLDGKRTVAELAGVLDGLFDAVPDSAPGEVAAFVEDLAKRGFVGFELT